MQRSESRRQLLKLFAAAGLSTAAIRPAVAQSSEPTADFSYSPDDPSVGDRVTLDGTQSTDAEGSIERYRWDVEEEYGSESYYSANPTHTWERAGEYTVTLEVTDNDGNTAQTSQEIGVDNYSPTAEFEVSPSVPLAGESITLDGSPSRDFDGTIESYEWSVESEYGDTSYYEAQPTHSWENTGTYTVSLEVTDNGGATGSVTREIGVGNTPPTASMTIHPQSPDVGEEVTFTLPYDTDPEDNIVWREWTIEGKQFLGYETQYTFERAGKYEITLLVRDSRDETDTTTQTLYVGNMAPDATITYSPRENVTTGTTITFDATESADPDGQIATYEWTFPNDTTKTGPTVDHQFDATGTHNVSVTITDNEGKTATEQTSLGVAPAPTTTTATTTTTTTTPATLVETQTPTNRNSRGPLSLDWLSPTTKYETAKSTTITAGLTALSVGAGALLYRRRSDQQTAADTLLSDAESRLTSARQAAGQGNLDSALSEYTAVVRSLEDATQNTPKLESPRRVDQILQTAKQERDEIEHQAALLESLSETLRRASACFQRAAAAHATRSITVAVADYRTAAATYEHAIEQLDTNEGSIFDDGVSFTIQAEAASIPESIRDWPNVDADTYDTLAAAGITALPDLIELSKDELEKLAERLELSTDVVHRLRAAKWWAETRNQKLASRGDIVAQLLRAKAGQELS